MHPDYFGNAAPEERERAEASSALLNSAHEVLADAVRRADWLVAARGGPSETEERQMPQAFLIEVLEWNEALEAAREAGADAAVRGGLEQLQAELQQRRSATLQKVGEALDTRIPPPAPDRSYPLRTTTPSRRDELPTPDAETAW